MSAALRLPLSGQGLLSARLSLSRVVTLSFLLRLRLSGDDEAVPVTAAAEGAAAVAHEEIATLLLWLDVTAMVVVACGRVNVGVEEITGRDNEVTAAGGGNGDRKEGGNAAGGALPAVHWGGKGDAKAGKPLLPKGSKPLGDDDVSWAIVGDIAAAPPSIPDGGGGGRA
jgi:hypothetical protein